MSVRTEQIRRAERQKKRPYHGNLMGIDTTIGFTGPASKTCQWIDDDPSPDDACKCGAPCLPGVSYCAPHEARAWWRRDAG